MAADIDLWLGVRKPKPTDEMDRLLYLDEVLENFGFTGPYHMVLRWYNDYQQWGRYPFGMGVYDDQPAWLLEDFATCDLLRERKELREKMTKDGTLKQA